LAGDALLPLGFEIISNPENIPDSNTAVALNYELAKAIGYSGMVGGQVLDMLSEKHPLSLETMVRMESLKTGKMFVFSCLAGAILGKADEKEKQALIHYAENFGLAFQITDDILDIIGDEKTVGKTLKKDDKNKKTTYISLYGLEKAQEKAKEYVENSCNALNVFGKKAQVLQDLSNFLLNRTY